MIIPKPDNYVLPTVILPSEKPVDFTLDWKFKTPVTFTAKSWHDLINKILPWIIGKERIIKDNGNVIFENRLLPTWVYWQDVHPVFHIAIGKPYGKRNGLPIWNKKDWGYAYFDGPVWIPQLFIGGKIWMSITPMEIISQIEAAKKATGTTLVGGLGLGCLLYLLKELNPTVYEEEGITVAEYNPVIRGIVGRQWEGDINIETQDAYSHYYNDAPAENDEDGITQSSYDTILFDIWMRYGDASDDPNWKKLKKDFLKQAKHYHPKNYKKRNFIWGWGDVKKMPMPKSALAFFREGEL